MISEAMGKILGMVLAYGVSGLGLFLAYVNYRKRILKAEKVMTRTAWAVVALIVLGVAGGALVVAHLAEPPAPESPADAAAAPAADAEPATAEEPAVPPPAHEDEPSAWPWVGILVPAVIFLVATWISAGLYRHFSRTGH
ncbi:MAG: hypothetical protein GY856_27175 [bacterium]|nr:hypothetical protein [bacterium]